jgi:hypothetical protein
MSSPMTRAYPFWIGMLLRFPGGEKQEFYEPQLENVSEESEENREESEEKNEA